MQLCLNMVKIGELHVTEKKEQKILGSKQVGQYRFSDLMKMVTWYRILECLSMYKYCKRNKNKSGCPSTPSIRPKASLYCYRNHAPPPNWKEIGQLLHAMASHTVVEECWGVCLVKVYLCYLPGKPNKAAVLLAPSSKVRWVDQDMTCAQSHKCSQLLW